MSRSLKKGPFIAFHIGSKIAQMNSTGKKDIIKTWSRSTTITPSMIGHTFGVHNGRQHIPVYINSLKIGHKLGEFVPTRTFYSHKKADQKGKKGKKGKKL